MFKGAIFDVDGTLIDSMEMWNNCGAVYLSSFGIKADPELSSKINLLPAQDSGQYLKEQYNLAQSAEEITAGINKIAYDFYMNEAKLKPHIPELLEAISSARIPMMVATASDSEIIKNVLSKFGIRHYFKYVYDCKQIGYDKSQKEFFTKCAEILGTDAENTWVFEDMLHAALSAHRAGLKVGVIYDLQSADRENEIRKICDFFFKTDSDFFGFINKISKTA